VNGGEPIPPQRRVRLSNARWRAAGKVVPEFSAAHSQKEPPYHLKSCIIKKQF